MAVASLTLGIISLFVWLLPLFGFPISICGVIIGVVAVAKRESRGGKSISGLSMSGIGFILTIINYVLGALLVLEAV